MFGLHYLCCAFNEHLFISCFRTKIVEIKTRKNIVIFGICLEYGIKHQAFVIQTREHLMEALHNETCFGAFCRKLRGGIP